jgi:integrase
MRKSERLTERTVRNAKPGMHCDGGGLYLQVTPGAGNKLRKSWVFRFATTEQERASGRVGRERQMGLGSVDELAQQYRKMLHDYLARGEKLPKGVSLIASAEKQSLAEARALAAGCRQHRREGRDPIEARDATRQAHEVERKLADAKTKTFDDCARQYIEAKCVEWGARHAAQWETTLAMYVSPHIGKLPVQAIDTALVREVLDPIWATKRETASRVRGRIEAVLDWARTSGFRQGENPARWKGHLDDLLSKRNKKTDPIKHHDALPYNRIGAFMVELRGRDGIAARALEYAILTAARTGEVLGARRGEIDLQAKKWTIPAARMKAGEEHSVPLSGAAVALLKALAATREGPLVFTGDKGRMLADNAMLRLLKRMGHGGVTVHGFRSTFRDWAAERTNFPNHVVEKALAIRFRAPSKQPTGAVSCSKSVRRSWKRGRAFVTSRASVN